jgi:hypothetical protein
MTLYMNNRQSHSSLTKAPKIIVTAITTSLRVCEARSENNKEFDPVMAADVCLGPLDVFLIHVCVYKESKP